MLYALLDDRKRSERDDPLEELQKEAEKVIAALADAAVPDIILMDTPVKFHVLEIPELKPATLESYDWGDTGKPETKPLTYEPGKGFVVVEESF